MTFSTITELDKAIAVHEAEIVDICSNPKADMIASTSNDKYVNLLSIADGGFGEFLRLRNVRLF